MYVCIYILYLYIYIYIYIYICIYIYTQCSNLTEPNWACYICNHIMKTMCCPSYHHRYIYIYITLLKQFQ